MKQEKSKPLSVQLAYEDYERLLQIEQEYLGRKESRLGGGKYGAARYEGFTRCQPPRQICRFCLLQYYFPKIPQSGERN